MTEWRRIRKTIERGFLGSIVVFFLIICFYLVASYSCITLSSGSTIRVFNASCLNNKRSVIMILPGGGYSSLARWNEGLLWIPFFHSKGYTVAVLEYRMPNQDHTIPMSDASEAINILRNRSNDLEFEKNRIGVMGFSAGGHLASTMMVSDNDAIRPDFVLLFYPVVSMRKELTHMDSHNNLLGVNASKELENHFSNELHISRKAPPLFLVVTKDDSIVNPHNSIALYNEMKTKGRSVKFHLYPNGGHGWGYIRSFPYRDQMNTDMINWLDSLNGAFSITP